MSSESPRGESESAMHEKLSVRHLLESLTKLVEADEPAPPVPPAPKKPGRGKTLHKGVTAYRGFVIIQRDTAGYFRSFEIENASHNPSAGEPHTADRLADAKTKIDKFFMKHPTLEAAYVQDLADELRDHPARWKNDDYTGPTRNIAGQ